METRLGEVIYSMQAQFKFAELSGDFNPVHVDEIGARREFSGGVVVHGIHVLSSALDFWHRLDSRNARITRIKCTFGSPTRIDLPVEFVIMKQAADSVSIEARSDGRVTMKCRLGLGNSDVRDRVHGQPAKNSKLFSRVPSHKTIGDVVGLSGEIPLVLDDRIANGEFHDLVKSQPSLLADLLATTRLVGMDCPGLHSIYSSLEWAVSATAPTAVMSYRVEEVDERVAMVRMSVSGATGRGCVVAFFRPAPKVQEPMNSVQKKVRVGEFAGQNALIIGGSRGIGEATAKIIAAGGGQTCITFRTGESDARSVCNEILKTGGACSVSHFDLAQQRHDLAGIAATGFIPTHLYYFPTPHVAPSIRNRFDERAFLSFSTVYVERFAQLFHQSRRLWPSLKAFFYPSSIAVEGGLPGFVEYASAKSAGEQLCRQYSVLWPHCRILMSRLPLIATDLTNSVLAVETANAVDVMIPIVREMHGS